MIVRVQALVAFAFGLGLLVILSACQAVQVASGSASAAPRPVVASAPAEPTNLNAAAISAAETAAVADGRELVWGAVTNCTCHEFVGTSSVELAISNANVGASVQELSETPSDLFFYVTYDPKVTTRDRVVAAIKKGGGRVKA